MATFEAFQDLKDTSNELQTVCGEVKEEPTRETLLKAAGTFQKIVGMMEDGYWKANEEYMTQTTGYLRQMIERVKEIIKYESGNQG